jgi:hypothetical protein
VLIKWSMRPEERGAAYLWADSRPPSFPFFTRRSTSANGTYGEFPAQADFVKVDVPPPRVRMNRREVGG